MNNLINFSAKRKMIKDQQLHVTEFMYFFYVNRGYSILKWEFIIEYFSLISCLCRH